MKGEVSIRVVLPGRYSETMLFPFVAVWNKKHIYPTTLHGWMLYLPGMPADMMDH